MSNLSEHDRVTFDMVVTRMDSIAAAPQGALPAPTVASLDAGLDALLEEKCVQHQAHHEVRFERAKSVLLGTFKGVMDVTALLRIVSNLVDNGVESLTARGQIIVSLYESPNILRIDVADTGRGIPERVLEQLGARPITHGKAHGQGIGLFHAFRVIEGHGGQMVICSHPCHGTIVSLRLYGSA